MMRLALLLPLVAGAAFAQIAGAPDPEPALADYTVVDAVEIPAPLVELTGARSAIEAAGAAVFEEAGCAACHRAPGHWRAPRIGPDLSDAGARLSPGEIRLMVVEPRIMRADTDMPSYYAVGVYGEAPDELVGRTRLSAAQIERVVAWLASLEGDEGPGAPPAGAAVGGD